MESHDFAESGILPETQVLEGMFHRCLWSYVPMLRYKVVPDLLFDLGVFACLCLWLFSTTLKS